MKERSYIAIDLKSFYASVECVERGVDPLTTNLVAFSIFSSVIMSLISAFLFLHSLLSIS